MSVARVWPHLGSYASWRETCDTLHGHTQVLGKLAIALAPPEPQFQHAALAFGTRGWQTRPMPAPDGSGAIGVALDLRRHEAVVEHSDGREQRVALAPNRSVGAVTRAVLVAVREIGGAQVEIDPAPAEVPWSVPLDEDEEHARYEPSEVADYFIAATHAALVLRALRARHDGRATVVNAWWGSFDVAVSLFSPLPGGGLAEFAAGWWPGDTNYPVPAFYAYGQPTPDGFSGAALDTSGAEWHGQLGEHVLDWGDASEAADPGAAVLDFFTSAFREVAAANGAAAPPFAEGG